MSQVLLIIVEVMSGVSIRKKGKYMDESNTAFVALNYFK